MATVGLINYGSGNFSSVYNALSYLDAEVLEIRYPEQLTYATHIILPGVGAFAAAMRKLESLNLVDAIRTQVLKQEKPFLGICVGMQILADTGYEFEVYPGLGLIGGFVDKIDVSKTQLRLPHIGWNELAIMSPSPLVRHLGKPPTFYFVHSYQFTPSNPDHVLATCNYGTPIVAAIRKENILGVQFHPEKSQHDGLQLLQNFITM